MNFMSLFQSEAEQIQKIDAAAENAAREAESEKPSRSEEHTSELQSQR